MKRLDELSFIVAGEAFRQVRAWQADCDQAVMRTNLEKRGIAQVVLLAGGKRSADPAGGYQPGGSHPAGKQQSVETVRKMPAPGQALPFYGPRGGGYRYTFAGCTVEAAQVLACRLQVENTALERLKAAGYAPLELAVEDAAQNGGAAAPGTTAGEALDLDDPQVVRKLKAALEGAGRQVNQLRFVIDAELLKKLAAWPRWGKAYSDYAFIFRPWSIGTEIRLRHVPSGEMITLSEG